MQGDVLLLALPNHTFERISWDVSSVLLHFFIRTYRVKIIFRSPRNASVLLDACGRGDRFVPNRSCERPVPKLFSLDCSLFPVQSAEFYRNECSHRIRTELRLLDEASETCNGPTGYILFPFKTSSHRKFHYFPPSWGSSVHLAGFAYLISGNKL